MAQKKNQAAPVRHPRSDDAPVRHRRSDDGKAFVRDPESGPARVHDDLAEIVAEAYLESATSGEERGEDMLNEFVVEELGGPFIEESLAAEDLTAESEPEPPEPP